MQLVNSGLMESPGRFPLHPPASVALVLRLQGTKKSQLARVSKFPGQFGHVPEQQAAVPGWTLGPQPPHRFKVQRGGTTPLSLC